MGAFDKLGSMLSDTTAGVVGTAQAFGEGVEKAGRDAFHGVVENLSTQAKTVVQAGSDLAKGAAEAKHDVAEAMHGHDVVGSLVRGEQHLQTGAARALGDAWAGAAKSTGQLSSAVHRSVVDLGGAAGHVADHLVDAAAHAATSVAGERAGAVVGQVGHGAANVGRVAGDGLFGAVSGFGNAAGCLAHATGDLIVGGVRMTSDTEYRDRLVAKMETTLHAVGAVRQSAKHDPGALKDTIVKTVGGAINAFNQEGLAAERQGRLAEWVGDKIGATVFQGLTIALPQTKATQAVNATTHLADTLGQVERAAIAAGKAGQLAKTAVGAERATEAVAGTLGKAAPIVGVTAEGIEKRASVAGKVQVK